MKETVTFRVGGNKRFFNGYDRARLKHIVLIGLCLIAGLCLFALWSLGFLHIRRNVDLVSKFDLADTIHIAVTAESGSGRLDVTDKAVIQKVLGDLRAAQTAPWLKYKTIAWAAFFDSQGREVEFEVYGGEDSVIFRKKNRFFEFRGTLAEMIHQLYAES